MFWHCELTLKFDAKCELKGGGSDPPPLFMYEYDFEVLVIFLTYYGAECRFLVTPRLSQPLFLRD